MKKKLFCALSLMMLLWAATFTACSSSSSSSDSSTTDECMENPSSPNCVTDEDDSTPDEESL
ncbi:MULTISPECIES: hypothetical protein [Fibrobacter]|uniref:hypothetical protein n=1 Tax=Fibrobacter TaxID=832 RepID=UPI00117BA1C3|nr:MULTISPECIES: hypothetical protein [Fibrobacter]MDD7298890.1 hypothetical protein [Fibrobacter intestinalis]